MTNSSPDNAMMTPTKVGEALNDTFRDYGILLGGSSMGKGLQKATTYYIGHHLSAKTVPDYYKLDGAQDLKADIVSDPAEDSFYVCDIGVVMSQFWQWRKYFPRVESFYAVKCNPDPLVIRTLAILGSNFDCASRTEFRLVQEICKDLPRTPEIIYANPCKSRVHLIEAVCKGVKIVTFDNAAEIVKCAAVSKKIKLVLRIITDDKGSQCRLSTKFGAPRQKWRPLLATAKIYGLEVVGVSFHVGSGCRDASRYELALNDAKEIFEMAENEFGYKMTLLDIGGGFPGETHSTWNPAALDQGLDIHDEKDVNHEGLEVEKINTIEEEKKEEGDDRFMFFTEIAERVSPMLDRLFPEESGVRLIAEPGRYYVAAYSTIVTSVVSCRDNAVDSMFTPDAVDDIKASNDLDGISRKEEESLVRRRGESFAEDGNPIMENILEEMADYSKLFARQNLAQQGADVYNDPLDLYKEGFATAVDLLGPPEEDQKDTKFHTKEGMDKCHLTNSATNKAEDAGLLTFAAAGEAVNDVVSQAIADSSPLQDDYAYYINDGVYGAFNNLVFDHATVRARHFRYTPSFADTVKVSEIDGLRRLHKSTTPKLDLENDKDNKLYASTVFGPTCDSIDVIARSVLLPKLKVGDWLYFQNMGAYTSAAASTFNGFTPTDKFYVCSIMPEYFEKLAVGPEAVTDNINKGKKDEVL
eukprot:CAMPEP_0197835490 /NCGR_PEP_ID=MMETSP1437-20131217/25890_1 /TAXON_ID=49252 ORGANISM="Eucampia antarctica, Strain CCMP1452" /NCGR_SAMPLE_ID=MMETSP1437 /ASSEMBLY_ACC=CAM_ASM_001096 /LENGTH=696 /DNA_ID=CAMNT_0043440957 /DNA_START=21 /DNA_END=2111 /DNA_ORIENTATION=+